MAASNVNVVVITGNLTQDPELRHTGGGTAVCELRVAVNSRRKDGQSGEWVDKPNYFDVTVWGAQGENCANYLAKGRPVAVEGRLDWREWEAKDGSGKRQAVQIVANTVQFLGSRDGAGGGGNGNGGGGGGFTPTSDVPADTSDFEGAAAGSAGAAAVPKTTSRSSRSPEAPQRRSRGVRVCSITRPMARARETSSDNKRAAAGAAPTAPGRASTRGSTPRSSTTRTSTCCGASSPTRGRPAAAASPDFPAATSVSSRWR